MNMIRLTALIVPLFLAGCGLWGDPPPPPEEAAPPSPVVAFMINNPAGTSEVLVDEDFGGNVRVTLEDVFLSAAGETCKRATLLSGGHEAEIVIICRNPDETWRLMPRVWGRGLSS